MAAMKISLKQTNKVFWFKETKGGFMFPDWEYPIVNNAIVLGVDNEGGSVSAKTTVEELERKIIWLTASAMHELSPLA